MAQRPGQGPKPRPKEGEKRRPSAPTQASFDTSYVDEILDAVFSSEDLDEDDGPDDETVDYLTAEDSTRETSDSTFERLGEEFFSSELPQMVHLIARSINDIRVVSAFRDSSYAQEIIEDLRRYMELNAGEIISMQGPETAEKISLDDELDEEKYREVQKNLLDFRVLLPNLHIILLRDIYQFTQEKKNQEKREEIIDALEWIYRELEPAGEFGDTSTLFDEYIYTISGLKGRASTKWGLYIQAIKEFYRTIYEQGRSGEEYASFSRRLTEHDPKGSKRKFLEQYGEELWRRLKRK